MNIHYMCLHIIVHIVLLLTVDVIFLYLSIDLPVYILRMYVYYS